MASETTDRPRITQLLDEWQRGDRTAFDRLVPIVHDELRRLARLQLRGENRGRTLQPTALVHEAYLRMVGLRDMHFRDRSHFLAMASRVMRRVLVEAGRARQAVKRGRSRVRVAIDPAMLRDPRMDPAPDLMALDECLTALAALDERKARVVELRFFGGLSVEETATALGVSVQTVARDWSFAKLWLHRALSGEASDG